jgi:hypothetical protein
MFAKYSAMQSLKEKVDLLIQEFVAGENNETAFKAAYANTLKFVQLVYTEESSQFTEMRDAIHLYQPGVNFDQNRLDLKANCVGVLNSLIVSNAA